MIQIKCLVSAPVEKVFRFWTFPEEIKRWWILDGYSTDIVEIDLRVDGKFRIGMKSGEGSISYVSGNFIEVNPAKKLIFTWTSEEVADLIKDTLLTVEFEERGGQTEITLKHEFLRPELQDGYRKGWSSILQKLKNLA